MQIENMCLKHMKSAIKDPQLQQLLTPDYSIGCKRILASDDYYPALAAENVRLVPAGLKQVCLCALFATVEATCCRRCHQWFNHWVMVYFWRGMHSSGVASFTITAGVAFGCGPL